jgi:hypothetical protein
MTLSPWLMLVLTLPSGQATQRMRVWRALKALGCGVLRDGVYLLPEQPETRQAFAAQASEIEAAGGSAQILALVSADAEQERQFLHLFDRTAEYTELKQLADVLRAKLKRSAPAQLAREYAGVQKAFAALAAIDYFPGPVREQMASLLADARQQIEARLNPGEPHPVAGKIQRLALAAYQGRVWATRKHLWVDRMASAWLIARFIDRKARFKWLTQPNDCPKRALGFDFDGATFTHVGSRVTFEVLLASFDLEEDAALARIAAIVHALDIGGLPVAEAAGLEAVLKGLRATAKNDDALLVAVAPVFDGLYAAFRAKSD